MSLEQGEKLPNQQQQPTGRVPADDIFVSEQRSSPVPVLKVTSEADLKSTLEKALHRTRKPVIFRGFEIGPCRDRWTSEYLIRHCPQGKTVKVHKSKEKQLDFRRKNFVYDTISFKHLIHLCSGDKSLDIEEENYGYYWYLRSIGNDPRGRDVSDIAVHFPKLAEDLTVPEFFPKECFFSSVFRITSPHVQLWTHYDTCDNILIQIKGRKRVVLYPPSEALNLYLDGDKSEIVDIDNPDYERYPNFKSVRKFECILEEGDVIFIPGLWFHNITALEYSISVNVFWKNLSADLYDKKDPYGNKDLIPAQLGYKTLEKIISQQHVLPPEYQDFYLRRMINRLEKRLDDLGVTKEPKEERQEGDPE